MAHDKVGEITIAPCYWPYLPSPTVVRRGCLPIPPGLPLWRYCVRCGPRPRSGRGLNRTRKSVSSRYWARRDAALILTVGGTGFSPRDRTPEATRRVIEREAPGLAEAMRVRGAESNPFAWLSRGVAGLRGSTLIVNLPGSQRGAEESLRCILPLLKHALEVAAGGQRHP